MDVQWKDGVVRKGEVFYNDEWHKVELSAWIRVGYELVHDLSLGLFGIGIVITCGIEGLHSENSKHPKGDAVDIRIWHYTKKQTKQLVETIKKEIDKNYDIVLEKDHIHLEYDPK